MTLDDLKALVACGESETLEFKETTGQRGDGAKAVCAMLNGQGGYVLFGVTDRGEVRGQQVSAKSQEDVDRELRRIEPPAFPAIEVVPVQGDRSVLVLRVSGSNQGPYTYDGRPYLRQGPQTLPMPRARYEELLLERLHGTQRWENQAVPQDVGIQDLDHEEIRRVLNAAVQRGRIEQPLEQDIPGILRGFGLMRDGALLQAAVALFGKTDQLQALYPQLSLRLGRFRGPDRLAPFEDNRRYWGHAFQLLQRAEGFLLDHTPIASRVLPKREREDLPAYLPAVTREALANALCHRDYAQASGAVTLAMYDDRLEVTNPGGLHFGLTPEALAAPHESRPWNPIIASVFYRAGIIESWGSGTTRMIEACKAAGRPLPTWEALPDGLAFTLRAPAPYATPEVTPEATPEASPEVRALLIHCQVARSRKELQALLGLKDPDHFRLAYLQPALEAGLIEMTLPDKPKSPAQKYRATGKANQS
ncbi:RNA-binding domain-containing protein [Holophaga foetida]|uniref:RNA-binding domain-containing protein n=1 Tax=Holophaga foetida TaxID=35839 RepID=UPI0002473747|nr:RNA-binding domain-containing protein [Holophaga foetida]